MAEEGIVVIYKFSNYDSYTTLGSLDFTYFYSVAFPLYNIDQCWLLDEIYVCLRWYLWLRTLILWNESGNLVILVLLHCTISGILVYEHLHGNKVSRRQAGY